jgi:hypothetical protein
MFDYWRKQSRADNCVDTLRRRMDGSALLIKALGGWTVSELPKTAELR